jgi:tetratricopeptide (TPR) repeat protein
LSKSFDSYQGALDGSAVRRLDILIALTSHEITDSLYLSSLRAFLLSSSINLSRLVLAWARVCEVPEDVETSSDVQVRDAMRHINVFRNRFAHIPFPYDGLEEIADALEDVTEQLFSIEPRPWQGFPDERVESPLIGAIHWRDRLLRGSMPFRAQSQTMATMCVFPATPKKNIPSETWDCQPFIFIDSMIRPHILTRLLSQSAGRWEYTRFRAEANSVIQKEEPEWLGLLPIPTEAEYRTAESVNEDREEANLVATLTHGAEIGDIPASIETRPANDFEEALRQIRNEEYEPAINYFAKLVKMRPEYHIGWLRLGHAQRELAMRIRGNNREKAQELLAESVDSLTNATKHIDPNRIAQALYERSKTLYHWGRSTGDVTTLSKALSDAEQAFAKGADATYESWIDYLKRNVPSDLSPPQPTTTNLI